MVVWEGGSQSFFILYGWCGLRFMMCLVGYVETVGLGVRGMEWFVGGLK